MFDLQLNFDSISAACRTARAGEGSRGLFPGKGSSSPGSSYSAGARLLPKPEVPVSMGLSDERQRTPISKMNQIATTTN